MATNVIYQDGFELYGDQFALALKYPQGGFDNILLDTGRSGSNSKCAFLAGVFASYELNVPVTPRYNYTVQSAIKFNGLSNLVFLEVLSAPGGYPWVTVAIDSNGRYYLQSYSGIIVRASVAVASNVWHHVCVQVRLNTVGDQTPLGCAYLYINQQLVASMVNTTINFNGTNSIGQITWRSGATPTHVYVDDAWIAYNDDNSPVAPNDYIIEHLMPINDNETSWTMNTSAPSRASLVSEIPPDYDATYISSNTYGNYQTFGVGSLTQIVTTVQSVRVALCARQDGSGTSPFSAGAAVNNGFTQGATNQTDLTTSWQYYDYVFNTTPDGGLWSPSVVSTSHFGVWTTS